MQGLVTELDNVRGSCSWDAGLLCAIPKPRLAELEELDVEIIRQMFHEETLGLSVCYM